MKRRGGLWRAAVLRHGMAVVGLGLASGLSGCAAVAMGGAAMGTGVISAARQDGGLSGAAEDLKISSGIGHNWLQFDASFINTFEASVREGRVLVTGVVAERGKADDAVRLVWQVPGVREVYNEIEIIPLPGTLADSSRDVWIASQLNSRLLFDAEITSVNYVADVTNGVVYLIGVAHDRVERDRVLGHARNLKYVRRVVSYIRFKGDTERPSP
ncbi:MAG: periplasmic or secreted lipoprotein [Rhodospirillaceae bacterium]|nr:MAG: periplasmic or secreted lipoprotein [Rhodospirillaceae bacterium]